MTHIYTDASVQNGDAGWAYIIIQNGRTISTGSGIKKGLWHIEHAEAHAVLMGIFAMLLENIEDEHIILWCDNYGVVRKLQKGTEDYNEINEYMKLRRGAYSVNHCPRRFNKHAKKVDNESKKIFKDG